jgi:predicted RNA-binding protein with PIN domain
MISQADSSADDARQLAVLFAGVAQDVDEYRSRHLRELTPKVRAQLEDAVQQLDEANDNLVSGAVRKTLREIENELDEISAIATQARQTLKKVKNTSSAANVAASVAALALAIASADAGAVPGALEDVTEALKLQQNGSSADDD